jgi:hypothetical protein
MVQAADHWERILAREESMARRMLQRNDLVRNCGGCSLARDSGLSP